MVNKIINSLLLMWTEYEIHPSGEFVKSNLSFASSLNHA